MSRNLLFFGKHHSIDITMTPSWPSVYNAFTNKPWGLDLSHSISFGNKHESYYNSKFSCFCDTGSSYERLVLR